MRTYALIPFVLFALLVPSVSHAATHYLWTPYDPDTDHLYEDQRIEIRDGGSYEIPLGAGGSGRVRIDDTNANPPFANGRGEAFFLPDPADLSVRESLGSAGGLAFEREGTYEIDAYARPVTEKPRNRFLAWLIPVAHAQVDDPLYVDTIRFSITHGPPLEAPCCSSVLFLPGMQGSVLSSGGDTLWPPSVWSNDVPKLALTSSGESVNPIVVDGVLDEFYGVSIYGGFIDFMDDLVDSDSGVNAWKAFAYDWRYPPEKVLNEGVETPEGTLFIVDEIEDLASGSNTGKVTIIAHSMGGLLGKAVIKELMERGEEHLIDTFIMVGTPQLGTPQGAAALLHGDDQAIPGGFWLGSLVVDPRDARTVAQNFESAYGLLPSANYFAKVSDPVITFNASAPFTTAWRAQWGPSIDRFSEFKDFATGAGVPRTNPTTDLTVPEVLNPSLFQNVSDWHAQYDSFAMPGSIRVVQVAGWGLPTVKSIDYRTEHGKQNYEVLFTKEGDGTVVYPSAITSNQNAYYLNLEKYRDPNNERGTHRDLLNAKPVQDLISYVLTNVNDGSGEFITTTKPSVDLIEDQLLVSTHSPVALGAYDSQGRFTGVKSDENPSSGLLRISEEIPGSSFASIGSDHYLFLPKSGEYDVRVSGTGTGPATIETSVISRDKTTTVAAYTDIPVTAATEAQMDLTALTPQSATVEVDKDGNGEVDSVVTPDKYAPTISELFTQLKTKIGEIKSKNKIIEKAIKTVLLKKVELLEKKVSKVRSKRATVQIVVIGRQILWLSTRTRIIEADVLTITDLLNQIEKQL